MVLKVLSILVSRTWYHKISYRHPKMIIFFIISSPLVCKDQEALRQLKLQFGNGTDLVLHLLCPTIMLKNSLKSFSKFTVLGYLVGIIYENGISLLLALLCNLALK